MALQSGRREKLRIGTEDWRDETSRKWKITWDGMTNPVYNLGPNWKYNEAKILEDIYNYCADTYEQHYAKENIEAFEFIADAGHGTGFTIGNIIKYAKRYGKKEGYNKKDLYKIIHYAMMEIWNLETNQEKSTRETD